jgi:tetratricopeptide (TPR) repeat protein
MKTAGLVALLVLIATAPASAQSSSGLQTQRRVILKPDAAFQADTRIDEVSPGNTDRLKRMFHIYVVIGTSATSIQLRAEDWPVTGSVRSTDVVPLEDGVGYFTGLLHDAPNDPTLYNQRGLVEAATRRVGEALNDYGQALALAADYGIVYLNRGDLRFNQTDYDSAIADYTQAIALEGNWSHAYYNLGNAQQAKAATEPTASQIAALYQSSIESYKQAIQIDPGFPLVYVNLGMAQFHLSQLADAINNFNKAIGMLPRPYGLAYLGRGMAETYLSQTDQALSDLAVAFAATDPGLKDVEKAQGYLFLAIDWYAKGDYAKVTDNGAKALGLRQLLTRDDLISLFGYLGDAYLLQQNYAAVVSNFTQRATLANSEASYSDLAFVLATCRDDAVRNGQQALQYALKARQLAGGSPSGNTLTALAAAYAETGDFANAVQYQNQANEALADNPAALAQGQQMLKLYQNGQPFHGT